MKEKIVNIQRNNNLYNEKSLAVMQPYMDLANDLIEMFNKEEVKKSRPKDSIPYRSAKNILKFAQGVPTGYYKQLMDDARAKIINDNDLSPVETLAITVADIQERILADCKESVMLRYMTDRTEYVEENFVIDVINEYTRVCGYVDHNDHLRPAMLKLFGEDIILDYIKELDTVDNLKNNGFIETVSPDFNKLTMGALDYLRDSGYDIATCPNFDDLMLS